MVAAAKSLVDQGGRAVVKDKLQQKGVYLPKACTETKSPHQLGT